MSTSARKISETFTGRREWIIGGAGYFKLLETINPVDVELYLEGRPRLVAAQVEGGFYQRIDFDRVVITTGGAEQVDWIFSPDEGGSDRFTGAVTVSGQVDVSDRAARLVGTLTAWPGKNRTASPGFVATDSRTPSAGNWAVIQLFNPAASGKTLYVDQAIAYTSTAARRSLCRHNAAASTLVGNGSNKTLDGAASVAEIRWTSAASPAGMGTRLLAGIGGANLDPTVFRFEEPIIVPAGYGVHLQGETGDTVLTASFEWREV